jgi:hypothetical protein
VFLAKNVSSKLFMFVVLVAIVTVVAVVAVVAAHSPTLQGCAAEFSFLPWVF